MSDPAPPRLDAGLPRGALAGVVVLDITRVVAGPYCSQILADLGATVIKIENPRDPDYTREFPPFLCSDDGERFSAFFAQYNRGKLGLTLDLATAQGRTVLEDLVKRADVLVENFRPGTMAKLGVGPERLRAINPRLVYTALSGYGQTGPYRERPAYDNTAQAAGGLWSMNGYPDRPPVRVGTIVGDLAATMFGVIGTLAALRHAERTGAGQLVDVSQQDSVLAFTENAVVRYTVDGDLATPLGNQHPFVRPYELFACADGSVFFGGYTDKFWRISCELFGEPELADDPELDTMAKRFDPAVYEARVRPIIERWLAERSRAELESLAGNTLPLTAIRSIGDVVADPHIAARDMVVDVDYGDLGVLRMFGQPIHLDVTPPHARALAPRVGEHTDVVLQGLAGYTDARVRELRRGGAV